MSRWVVLRRETFWSWCQKVGSFEERDILELVSEGGFAAVASLTGKTELLFGINDVPVVEPSFYFLFMPDKHTPCSDAHLPFCPQTPPAGGRVSSTERRPSSPETMLRNCERERFST